jgi:hypothetical protein
MDDMEYESEIARLHKEADELFSLSMYLLTLLGYNIRAKSKAQWELSSVASRLNGILNES